MDRIQSAAAESRHDQGPLVFIITSDPVCLGSTDVQPVSSIRDLGVNIDADMTMKTHVTAVVRPCFAALR